MLRRLSLGKNSHLTYYSLGFNPRNFLDSQWTLLTADHSEDKFYLYNKHPNIVYTKASEKMAYAYSTNPDQTAPLISGAINKKDNYDLIILHIWGGLELIFLLRVRQSSKLNQVKPNKLHTPK